MIVFADDTHIAAGVDEAWIIWIKRRIRALTSTHLIPVLPGDATLAPTRDRHRAVVLLATVDVVRKTVVHVHSIKLCSRLILLRRPGRTTVE